MGYKSDIEIAQECTMQPITAIAEKAGIDDKYLEQYGKYKAKIDYNLLKETDKKDGKLMIDETQADFVRELFEMYATGKFSMKQMEKHFYQKGIRNSKGKMLSHSTMSNIIRNPKYKGYYAGNKVRITDLFTKKQKFLPEEEWVMYKDETGETVPAIVSEELWNEANEVLYMRSQDVITAQHKTVHQNLLTGKLICAHCGMPYYRKDAVSKGGEKISKWVCSGKIKNGASSCPSRAIYESEIKPIIEDIFKSGQQHIEELSACVLKLVSEVLDTNENKDELNRLNQELITRQKMKAKLLQYNADGRMNDNEFIRMTADCDDEIKDIEKKINALNKTSKTEREMKKELAAAEVSAFVAHMKQLGITPEEIRQLLAETIEEEENHE